MQSYNISLIGCGGAGKTTFLRHTPHANYTVSYNSTLPRFMCAQFTFVTSVGTKVKFVVTDVYGDEDNIFTPKAVDFMLSISNGIIIMVGPTSPNVIIETQKWLSKVDFVCNDTRKPTVMCVNGLNPISGLSLPVFENACNDCTKLFETLARQITGDASLQFISL